MWNLDGGSVTGLSGVCYYWIVMGDLQRLLVSTQGADTRYRHKERSVMRCTRSPSAVAIVLRLELQALGSSFERGWSAISCNIFGTKPPIAYNRFFVRVELSFAQQRTTAVAVGCYWGYCCRVSHLVCMHRSFHFCCQSQSTINAFSDVWRLRTSDGPSVPTSRFHDLGHPGRAVVFLMCTGVICSGSCCDVGAV